MYRAHHDCHTGKNAHGNTVSLQREMKQSAAAFMAPYRQFFALPDIPAMILGAWLSRMPISMNALSMLLFLRESLGNFEQAGTIVGTFFIAMAIAAPFMGRMIDRVGPRRLLMVAGSLHPILMLVLFLAGDSGAAPVWLYAIAFAAGAFAPPSTVITRTVWRHRFTEETARKLAYSIDAIMIEFNFTVGPLLVAGLVAAFNPRVAFATVIVISSCATVIFFASPILKYWQQEPPSERHLLGPLTELKLVWLFTLTFGMTFCFGLLEVGYPAYATSIGWVAFGGILLAINSLGSAVGGFVYGALHVRLSLERQFAFALGIMAIPLFLHGVVDQRFIFGTMAFLAGCLIAPAFTAQTLLVTRITPAKYATEAFTWSSTFIVIGLGIGTAVGGVIAENVHIKAPFVLAGAIVAVMSFWALWMKPQEVRPGEVVKA